MNYKDFNLGDWIGHISGAIEDERELDGNEMRDLVEFLSKLPKWIPVSERLPEYSGNYLITIADSNYKSGQHFEISWFYPSDRVWSFRNADVIAWMPLSKPFDTQAESEG